VTIWVYALIASSSSRVIGSGMSGERLRAIRAGRITALVGELRRAPKPTMTNLRRYAMVIGKAAAQTPAILPVRFGTGMADLDEVTFVLRSRQDTLRRRLRAVRGRAQMTLRVVSGRSGRSGSDPGDNPSSGSDPGDESTQGTQYLQQRAITAARAREIPGFAPIRVAVKRWVKDERVEKRGGVITVNHLIPRSSVSAYRSALERAAERAGLRVIVTGPFPPYAFAENW
jgi:gas vesicle protein GvpL/GvpF